ncbi:tRNA pseudouridine(55) synthase TruB [Salinibacillus xinjiangensis]|uniref:tRNA pseudouridine synthase B n=1 Tax=Salinibacillus xinjiangensis TaxID=1229268 RepID=A0A6G1X326_9BACI|nr:tRNA pseudouridine(55) synthase TruB [Salinibacillus xinjiangensis]MRG85354.1 tRNA pseudouridine(55) synthase TruB [Salinibacillus xinjiangensis]
MDGILPLWKPAGMTSHDSVFKIRKILRTKKVGHTGTLDPQVEGVLPICIGQATKISSLVMDSNKVYEAEVCLGISTETEDQDGQIVESRVVEGNLSIEQIETALKSYTGEIEQMPPMYSAVKVNGKKLYEYAREGISVERPKRLVMIHSTQLLSDKIEWSKDQDTASFRIRINCSKGTYIRTLCVDIGKALGYPAHMAHLVRTESGSFTREQTMTLDEVKEAQEQNKIQENLIPIDFALQKFDTLYINEKDSFRYQNGQVLPLPNPLPSTNPFRVKTKNDQLLALYQIHPTKGTLMKPFKMFAKEK